MRYIYVVTEQNNVTDPGETLYIASANDDGGVSELGAIDTSAYTLSTVDGFRSSVTSPELTGTGDGHLCAFSTESIGPSFVAEIIRRTAAIDTLLNLPSVTGGNGWAFAS